MTSQPHQRTIIIGLNSRGRYTVHLRGAHHREFDTVPEAQAHAEDLQRQAGGPGICRIVTSHEDGE